MAIGRTAGRKVECTGATDRIARRDAEIVSNLWIQSESSSAVTHVRRWVVIMAAAVVPGLLAGTGASAAVSHSGTAGAAALRAGAVHAQGGRADSAPARAAHQRSSRQLARRTRTHSAKLFLASRAGAVARFSFLGRVSDAAMTGSQGLAVDRARGRAPPATRARRSSAFQTGARVEVSLSTSGPATTPLLAGDAAGDPAFRIAFHVPQYCLRTFGEPDCGETCATAGDPGAATDSFAERVERLPDRFRTDRPEGAAGRGDMPSSRGNA